jgi:hypothetical protein
MKFVDESVTYEFLYRGEVLDNNDPDMLGRIKVNVFGIYKDIAAADLPWCVPMQPTSIGAGSGFGLFSVPRIGSIVFVMFEAGDIYQPICVGSAPDGVHGLPTERTTNYPDRIVLKTQNGVIMYIDDKTGEINIEQPSGSFINMDASGNIVVSGTSVSINP